MAGGSGALRIGIHVQGFTIDDKSSSESFVNHAPVPATVWLTGSGLVGLGLLRSRRRQNKS